MSNGSSDAKYHFVNHAGTRFATKGYYPEHNITLKIKDGGKWGKSVEIGPGERYDYAVKKGVSEIEIKSDVVGWPKYRFAVASANPHYHVFVYVKESAHSLAFTYDYS
jgi:hypothetical protein